MVNMVNEAASGSGPAAAAVSGRGTSRSGGRFVGSGSSGYYVDAKGRVVGDYQDDVAPSPVASPAQEAMPFLERVKAQMGRVPSMVPRKEDGVYPEEEVRRAGGTDAGAEDVRLDVRRGITAKEINDMERDLDK